MEIAQHDFTKDNVDPPKTDLEGKTDYISMEEITYEDYLEFSRTHSKVYIEDSELEIGKPKRIKYLHPKEFKLETTTVWSFPKRGDWATHYLNAKYRGNWAPQVARNLILRYSNEEVL